MKQAGTFTSSVEISQREISGGMGDMAVTRERRNEIKRKSDNKIYKQFSFKIRRDSGVLESLEEACTSLNTTVSEYIHAAIKKSLIADGYNPDDYKPQN